MILTKRQRQLLNAILEEFTKTAVPVGSVDICDHYDIDVSPATIRNDMVELSKMGYLEKEHVSAGRRPTTLAWRWYLSEAYKEESVHPKIEVEVKTRIFRNRFQKSRLVKEAVDALSKITNYPSIAIVEDTIYYSGIAELLEYPEFQEIEVLQKILNILEDYSMLNTIFHKYKGDDRVKVLIGEEISEFFDDCSLVFGDFEMYRNEHGIIGVIGPSRMKYSKVIPAVRYVADSLGEAISGWE